MSEGTVEGKGQGVVRLLRTDGALGLCHTATAPHCPVRDVRGGRAVPRRDRSEELLLWRAMATTIGAMWYPFVDMSANCTRIRKASFLTRTVIGLAAACPCLYMCLCSTAT
eukprot:EG_transcript_17676